jgi:CcmD family protein
MLIALIQQAPAETTNYMVAGYTVIFSVIFAYIFSLIIRSRSLKREVQTLNDLEAEEK